MNEELIVVFKAKEVFDTVKSMTSLKASGTNGFPTLFYQKN